MWENLEMCDPKGSVDCSRSDKCFGWAFFADEGNDSKVGDDSVFVRWCAGGAFFAVGFVLVSKDSSAADLEPVEEWVVDRMGWFSL